MVASTNANKDIAVELRPGVFRPDWSAVTIPTARAALRGRIAARASLLQKWAHPLTQDEDCVWQGTLRLYADLGRPPLVAEIAEKTASTETSTKTLLDQLRERDLLGLDATGTTIHLAYPFTATQTGHCVAIGRHHLAPSVRLMRSAPAPCTAPTLK
jgi:alkylmercury lyase